MKPPASSSLLATTNLKNPTISIPVDVLLEIWSRLPIETLYRCRYVSKSWQQLIDDHFLRNSLPSTVAGFFHMNYKDITTIYAAKSNNDIYNIDSAFSFLPCHRHFIIDSCRNGLILGSGIFRHYDEENHRVIKESESFVCNPATKSWIMLPKLASASKPILLDFNPCSSPHYRVFSVDTDRNCWIYTSRTRKWSLQEQGAFRAAFLWQRHAVTFWKDAAYTITNGYAGIFLTRGYKALTRLPVKTEVPSEICFGEFQELGLCLAHLQGFQLTVWSHGGEAADEWVIRHRSYVEGLRPHRECHRREGDVRRCLAFHPFTKAVFILYDMVIYTYHLGRMAALEEFCRLGSYNMDVFPFLPCLLDVIGDGTHDAEGRDVEKD